MEDTASRKNKFQLFYSQLRTSFFNITFELLKEKNTGVFFGCLIILIMFIQLIGLIFVPIGYEWRDEFFLTFVVQLCNYCRVIQAINESGSLFFYWALMISGFCYITCMLALLVYMNYFLKNKKHYVESVVRLLRVMILLMYWIFYQPFFESFISIIHCEKGYHYLDRGMACFEGLHIFYFVLCIIFLILLFVTNIIIAMLYNETQPVQEDCLSRLESSFEVALIIYRSIVATFATFCSSEVCSWILISVFILASILLCYQYYKQIPYYNSFVSIFWGSLIFISFWISINGLLMKLLRVNGHIIIIFIGIPFIAFLVKNLREKRIETLLKTNMDKLKLDIDSLIQVHKMTDFSRGVNCDQAQRMTMIGIVNLHIMECQNSDCPCKDEYELYDVTTNQFTNRNKLQPHLDEVFLNHLIKRLYEDSLNKFINSPSIHIAFAFYLFKNMKNIHASLVELNVAIKKKPSLQQQFTIFRYKNIIEDYIKQDHLEHKFVYPELTNVIEFERLFSEMQKAIEKVCNLQVEFWTHLTTVVPDQNVLNELGKKIYTAAQEAESFWNQLCKINPNYQQALNIYGEYLKDIRNHEHLGNTYIEKGFNSMNAKKSIDEHAKSSDVLFSSDTTVIHISGNKESIGKILKTSQGLSSVFGYSKTEVIGHSTNILMPTLFAKRHTEFMERFFKTGRQIIFYQERTLFATHRNGHCFQMKLLVKQMPSLNEGIQYVGMIRPISSDYEYILTDMDGIIDSFSKGVTSMLGLTPNLFKDKDSQINIQILAPDLIPFFLESQQKGRAAKSKYRESGGDTLTLIVPRDFHSIAKTENKQNTRSGSRGRTGGANRANGQNVRNRSQVFKQFLKALAKPGKIARDRMPAPKILLQQPEYVQFERKKESQCEITCLDIKVSTNDSLKMLVFKFNKNDKSDKKKDLFMGNFGQDESQRRHTSYDEFKQVSVIEDTPRNNQQQQFAPKFGPRQEIQMPEIKPPSALESGKKVGFADQQNSEELRIPLSQVNSKKSGTMQSQTPGILSSHVSSSHQNQGSNQVESEKVETQRRTKSNFASQSRQSAEKSSSKSGQSRAADEDNEDEDGSGEDQSHKDEEVDKLDSMDQSEVMTPKLDVSGIKLESAQKEKNSFLEELKKQSFIFSETSTQKMEAKESIMIGVNTKQEKNSFQQQLGQNISGDKKSKSSSLAQFLPDPESMVRKDNLNNIKVVFAGDDIEPQETLQAFTEEGEQKSDDEDDDQRSKSKSDDEDGESEEGSLSKSKQSKTKSSKAGLGQKSEPYDSESNEEDYEDEGSEDKKSKYKSSKSSKKSEEAKPLLGNQQQQQQQQSLLKALAPDIVPFPNMSDFKRGFEEEFKDINLLPDPRKLMYGNRERSVSQHSDVRSHRKQGIQKRDTQKIKTNPKYKCLDDASEDENEMSKQNEDPQQLSSKELQFRDNILKYEKRKKLKERKQKEKEIKKMRAIKGEDGSSGVITASDSAATRTAGGSDDDEIDSSSSSSSSSEETKDLGIAKTKGGTNTKGGPSTKKNPTPSHNDQGDVSSVTTRQTKTERSHYNLRMAIDEKYIPNSIKNLKYAAYAIFLVLALLSIVYYVMQISLFDKINQNIENIHNSEQRFNYIIDITLRTRSLILTNRGFYPNLTDTQRSEFLNTTISELRSSASNLKNAQTDLSLRTSTLDRSSREKINPNDLKIEYLPYPNMPTFYLFSIWEAIMEIVVGAFRLSAFPLSQLLDTNHTAFFVIKNSMNSILLALKQSTDAIISESEEAREENMAIFLYLLIAASCSLFLSLAFLIPVINKIKKGKQEVLKLFTHKNVEKHIDDQLKVCRNFVSTKLQQTNEGEQHDIDGEDVGQMNVNDKELQNELNNNKYMKRIRKKNKGKKLKELNTDFVSTLLKFLLFICIIEGYFLANYLLSSKFLNEVRDLTQELKLLISRQPVQSFLLLIQKELIYSNGTALIEGEKAITFVPKYHERLYDEEEQLLDKFSANYDYHSSRYNEAFNNIIYSNVCQHVQYSNTEECENFNQGILRKGIYSSVIKYWDFLRQINHDFLESNRTQQTIIRYINDPRLQVAERMQDYYFKKAISYLVQVLEDDINDFFERQHIQNRTIFIIYIIYIFFLYFLIWRKYMDNIQDELWKTKSMLSVLPTKLCFDTEEIRTFINRNSSNDILSTML